MQVPVTFLLIQTCFSLLFLMYPVFADSAIVIFAPLCKAMSRVTGKSVIGLALSLAVGLQLTHCLVPPTPGPLTAAFRR